MKMPSIGKIRWAASRLRSKFLSGTLILFYHRVAELPSDPQLLCVTPERFSQHLEILRKFGRTMRLQELDHALREGKVPDRTLIVTFDDGYADNLYNAKPLLEHYDVPATVFVTSGYIGKESEFWWDELDRLLLQPITLPKTLCMNINGSPFRWELGEASQYTEDCCWRYHRWNVEVKDNPSSRHGLYRSLCQLLHPLPEEKRREAINELLAWADADLKGRATHRVLSTDEVLQLAEGGLVEVGSHTATHPVLSALPMDVQWEEIRGSKARLEEILGHPIYSFAYPYGTPSDYTEETAALVQKSGFRLACSNFPGVIRRGTDSFQLPRLLVRDWDEAEFTSRLRRWLGV